MREVAELLNRMQAAGVITDYALFGAAAQMRYTEPVATLDADVLVVLPGRERLDLLTPVYDFCRREGYAVEGDAVVAGSWPVQFIPVFSPLTEEAVRQAETVDLEGAPIRVVRPDHLALIALSVGRAKDFMRILALLEAGSVQPAALKRLAKEHGLLGAWQRFEKRYLNA